MRATNFDRLIKSRLTLANVRITAASRSGLAAIVVEKAGIAERLTAMTDEEIRGLLNAKKSKAKTVSMVSFRPTDHEVNVIAKLILMFDGLSASELIRIVLHEAATDTRRAAIMPQVTAQTSSSLGGTATNHAFVPQTPENLSYDVDGNLISDGRWNYFWDAENRMKAIETFGKQTGNANLVWNSGVPLIHVDFKYDYKGRRISKLVSTWNGAAFAPSSEIRYLYNNWNLLADYNVTGTTLSLAHSYLWGINNSGKTESGGGVGGLLAVSPLNGVFEFPVFDANGNITGLTDRASGKITAAYEYSSFGQVLRSIGIYAQSNPYRFSTKYADDETDLVYYGHRYYNAALGRFLARDPIQEKGGLNLYGFVNNGPSDSYDKNGELFGVDDLFLFGSGALGGAFSQAYEDLIIKQKFSGFAAWTGAVAGGGVTVWSSEFATIYGGAALGTATKEAVTKYLLTGTLTIDDLKKIGQDAGVASLLVAVIPKLKIPNITSNRNSMDAVGKAISSKLKSGALANFTAKSVAKKATAEFVGGIRQDTVTLAIDESQSSATNSSNHPSASQLPFSDIGIQLGDLGNASQGDVGSGLPHTVPDLQNPMVIPKIPQSILPDPKDIPPFTFPLLNVITLANLSSPGFDSKVDLGSSLSLSNGEFVPNDLFLPTAAGPAMSDTNESGNTLLGGSISAGSSGSDLLSISNGGSVDSTSSADGSD